MAETSTAVTSLYLAYFGRPPGFESETVVIDGTEPMAGFIDLSEPSLADDIVVLSGRTDVCTAWNGNRPMAPLTPRRERREAQWKREVRRGR